MASLDESMSARPYSHGDLSLASPSTSTEFDLNTLVADDTYYQLKRSFLPMDRGRPAEPPPVVLTNRLLLQLCLLKTEGNKTNKNVAGWFEKLFPDVSYPSSRLGGALGRLMKKATEKHEAGADLSVFLDTVVDFDSVSSALTKLGLKRGQLFGEQEIPESHRGRIQESVSQEVIVDLENFRSKEKLKDSFTVKWVHNLTAITESDNDLKTAIKQMMNCYKTLVENQVNPAAANMGFLSNFLVMPFTVRRAGRSISETNLTLSTSVKSVSSSSVQSNELEKLRCQVNQLLAEKKILTDVNRDLSQDKMRLLTESSGNKHLKQKVENLEAVVAEQRLKLRDLKPNRLRYLQKTNTILRAELRAVRDRENRHNQLKIKYRELKQKSYVLQQSHQRTVRRAKQRLQDLQKQYQELYDGTHVDQQVPVHTFTPKTRTVKNRFTNSVRKTLMDLQSEGNVPATKCTSVNCGKKSI